LVGRVGHVHVQRPEEGDVLVLVLAVAEGDGAAERVERVQTGAVGRFGSGFVVVGI
jgi:hypothetical protein